MGEQHKARAAKLSSPVAEKAEQDAAPFGRMKNGKPYREPPEVRAAKNKSQKKRRQNRPANDAAPSTVRLVGMATRIIEYVPCKYDPLLDLIHGVDVKGFALEKDEAKLLAEKIDSLPDTFGMGDDERDEIAGAIIEAKEYYSGDREAHPLVTLSVAVLSYLVPTALAISETKRLLTKLESRKKG